MPSSAFALAIAQHTPLGVWALLAALVALGVVQSKARSVTVSRAAVLPHLLHQVRVGVSLAQQPGLKGTLGFAVAASLAYGLFSGVFLGRALVLWRKTQGRAVARAA